MSRVGQMPINVPDGVKVSIKENHVKVEGPKGKLERTLRPEMAIKQDGSVITIERPSDEPQMRAFHGLTRSLLNNMVIGTSQGFEKELEIHGVGYRAELKGNDLLLNLGFSHPVEFPAPEGISFEVETRAGRVVVRGIDKQLVGQVAADIRKIRPPEPYKGKGIRYVDEYVRRKAGKAGVATV